MKYLTFLTLLIASLSTSAQMSYSSLTAPADRQSIMLNDSTQFQENTFDLLLDDAGTSLIVGIVAGVIFTGTAVLVEDPDIAGGLYLAAGLSVSLGMIYSGVNLKRSAKAYRKLQE